MLLVAVVVAAVAVIVVVLSHLRALVVDQDPTLPCTVETHYLISFKLYQNV